jgi:hypothetical protein
MTRRAPAMHLVFVILAVACGTGPATVSPAASLAPSAAQATTSTSVSPTPVPVTDPRAEGSETATVAMRKSPTALYAGDAYLGAYEERREPGASLDHGVLPTIGYVVQGSLRWTTSIQTVDLKAGDAVPTPDLPFTENNPGSVRSIWWGFLPYSFSGRTLIRNVAQRVVIETPKLPEPQPEGSYTMRLDVVTLQVGGRTAAVKHAGASLIVVLAGNIEIRQQAKHDFRGPDQGVALLPDAPVQVFNTGPTAARFLAYFDTPDAGAFETLLSASP